MAEDSNSATDTLVRVMEQFSGSEAVSVIVIWTDENDEIWMDKNCYDTQAVGLLEFAKHSLLNPADEEDE